MLHCRIEEPNIWNELDAALKRGSRLEAIVRTSDGREVAGTPVRYVVGWVQLIDRHGHPFWLNMSAIVSWTLHETKQLFSRPGEAR